jgi:tripartite-type tricarboxylate transporter receptor subunit TctC
MSLRAARACGRALVRLVAAVAALAGAATAAAQAGPGPAIRIVVPFTPGTGGDTIARAVAPRLAERIGQAVVVHNMPGASGTIGAEAVAKAAPDGNTLLMGANAMLIASRLEPRPAFDPVKDLEPVALAASGTLMLVAHPRAGIGSVADLLAAARTRPGALDYGSPGIGTPHHMAMELLKARTGVSLQHIPYSGTAGYVQDLLGGRVAVGFLPVHVAHGFVAAGRLNALAVASARRSPVAPAIATLDELGQAGFEVGTWYAFFAPRGTPAAVVRRLQQDLAAVLDLRDVRESLNTAGLEAGFSTPDQLGQLVRSESERWGSVIRRNGIAAQ